MKKKGNFKNMTLEHLAQMVAKGFEQSALEIDAVQIKVTRGFASVQNRFDALDKRLEKIESRLEGAHNRIDAIADMVRPVEQLIPLITKDFYKRFVEVEEKVKHL